jgi:hypothetical protein
MTAIVKQREDTLPHSRGAETSGFCKNHVLDEKRAQGMPGVELHPQPGGQWKKSPPAQSPQEQAEHRHSLRNGFNGCFVLSPVRRACWPPSPRGSLRGLIPASGDRDHTTWPSATLPHALRHDRVHCIPRPTFVAIATRPQVSAGRITNSRISVKWKKNLMAFGK